MKVMEQVQLPVLTELMFTVKQGLPRIIWEKKLIPGLAVMQNVISLRLDSMYLSKMADMVVVSVLQLQKK